MTNSGKEALCISNFIYRLDRKTEKSNSWRCTRRSCTATCRTNKLDNVVIAFRNHHNHEEMTDKELAVKELRQNCKRLAAEDLYERPAKFIRRELSLQGNQNEILARDVDVVRKAMYNERRKRLPTLPKDRQQTHQKLAVLDLKSCRGEEMMHMNDEDTGLVVFTTQRNLEFLCGDGVSIFGDGTFKVCPKFFHQMYTLHAHQNGQYVPCAICLLPTKTRETYRDMFVQLRIICARFGFNLNIDQIHLDFELAAHQAVKDVWPNVSIKGCQFHLFQAWWRKMQNLGLSVDYKSSDSEIGRWLKSFFGLGFLPPAEVSDSFAFDIVADGPHERRSNRFADYVLQTYVSPDALFPPQIWADPDIYSQRTTNACEAFHKHFADLFYRAHPSIFEFTEKLKQMQTHSYTKIAAANAGMNPTQPRRQRRQRLHEMETTRRQYESHTISRKEFVTRMAFKCLPS